MKTRLLLIFLSLACTSTTFAGFNLGVKGGYTTTLSFSTLGNAGWATINPQNAQGLHVGLFARIGNKVYFQPELLYNREINENTFSVNEIGEIKQLSTISTCDIPFLFGWRMFRLGDGFNMRFTIGPKFRFNLNSSTKNAAHDGSWHISENYIDELHPMAVGLDTGLGMELFGLLNLEVRYNLISDMRKTTTLSEIGSVISTHYKDPLNTFNVSIGIKFWK